MLESRFLVWITRTVLVKLSLLLTFAAHGSDWTYVASADEAGFSRPLFRTVALSTDKPDVNEQITYRGKTQRYAMLRYGTPNSLRVAIVVDEVTRSDFDLYVDADRDRTIVAKEKVGGSGRLRYLSLDAELSHAGNGSEMLPRQVVFRRGISARSLSFATVGFIDGSASLDGVQLRARRVDGDSDGLFSAARDRVWLDLDGNNEWDAFSEQFPYMPILKLAGVRYAVRGDVAGKRLEFRELTGTGTVRLALNLHDSDARIIALDVMLAGSDGYAVSLQGAEKAVTVPIGTYTVNTVQLSVKDSATSVHWDFVFSDNGERKRQRSFAVMNGKELSIDPIGALRFELDSDKGEQPVKPGSELIVQPWLYTEDGLLINSSRCGLPTAPSEVSSNAADISLRGKSGLPIASTRSGFA